MRSKSAIFTNRHNQLNENEEGLEQEFSLPNLVLLSNIKLFHNTSFFVFGNFSLVISSIIMHAHTGIC